MISLKFSPAIFSSIRSTVESRYNEPLYNDVLGITNDFLYRGNGKYREKNLDITNPP